jgi:CO/xanthine dehydrogenase Mo-binding subunit
MHSRLYLSRQPSGAKKFGWEKRKPLPGTQRQGEWLIGMGCATADEEGKFGALIHTGVAAMTPHNDCPEQFTFSARHLYSARSFKLAQQVADMDMVANTFMRAPGESVGTFALECAIERRLLPVVRSWYVPQQCDTNLRERAPSNLSVLPHARRRRSHYADQRWLRHDRYRGP